MQWQWLDHYHCLPDKVFLYIYIYIHYSEFLGFISLMKNPWASIKSVSMKINVYLVFAPPLMGPTAMLHDTSKSLHIKIWVCQINTHTKIDNFMNLSICDGKLNCMDGNKMKPHWWQNWKVWLSNERHLTCYKDHQCLSTLHLYVKEEYQWIVKFVPWCTRIFILLHSEGFVECCQNSHPRMQSMKSEKKSCVGTKNI